MKRIDKDMEHIERYLDNQVDEKEREEVGKRLVEDAEFRKLFDEMEAMLDGIRHSASKTTAEEKLQNLEATIHRLEEKEENENEDVHGVEAGQVHKPIIIVWYNRPVFRAIAASVVLLVVAYFVFGPFGQPTPKELFAEYHIVYPNRDPNVRGGNEQQMDDRALAFVAYDHGEFTKAASMFEDILHDSQDITTDRFYLGNSYLKMDEGDKAIEQFRIVADAGKGLALQAKWYLGLSYLSLGNGESAKEALMEVKDAGSDYSRQASEILDQLK